MGFALLPWLTYVAAALAFCFCTLSLASALLYTAEIIEEHSKLAQRVGKIAIYTICGLHILLFVFDGLPWHVLLFGIFCHIVYLTHFSKDWPLITLTSPRFLVSCVLVVANHILWFYWFAGEAKKANQYQSYRHPRMAGRASKKDAHTFFEVVTFFAFCVWLIPFYLFLSLSANDNVLPSQLAGSSDVPGLGIQTNPLPNQRTSILKSVLSKVVNALPAVGRKGSKTSRSQLDGLISPAHSAPPSPIPWAPKEPNQQHTYPSYFSSAPNSTESQRLSPQPPSSSRFPDRLAPTSPMLGGAAGVPPRRVASDANLRQANAAITSPQLQGRRSVQSTEDDSFVDTPIWGDYGKKAD